MKTKLILLFQALSEQEQKQFIAELSHTSFNSSARLTKLGEYWLVNKNQNKEEAFKRVYGKYRIYNDLLFRQLENNLLQLLKKFIANQEFQHDTLDAKFYELNRYKKSNLIAMQEETLKKVSDQLNAHEQRDSDFYYKTFHYYTEAYLFNLNNNIKQGEEVLKDLSNSLEEFYLYNKLKYYCIAINQKNIIQTKNEIISIDALLKQFKVEQYKHNPGILIYYYILLTLTKPEDENNFLRFEKTLIKNFNLFTDKEANDMFVFAQNYCIKQSNKGDLNYLDKLFKFYSISVENKLVMNNGIFSPQSFKNIVAVALRLKKIKWVEDFIKTYYKMIVEEHRQNAYDYNIANLYYYKKDYKKCLHHLQEVNFKNMFYGFDAKILLIKTYFEKGDYESLDSFLYSFYMFIKRNKLISAIHKTNYLNFMFYLKKLMKIKKYVLPKQIEKIEMAIVNAKDVTNKTWLLEMIGNKKKSALKF